MRQRHVAPCLERHASPAPQYSLRLFWETGPQPVLRPLAAQPGGSQVELALHELEDCLPAPGGPEQALDEKETGRVISQFLRSQPELDRALFIRRYWHLESIAALAQSFHLRESQVKSRLFRTRQRLKAALEQEGIAV